MEDWQAKEIKTRAERAEAELVMTGKHEVGLVLEWVSGGIVLKAKDRSFALTLSAEMTRELRDALVEVLGV